MNENANDNRVDNMQERWQRRQELRAQRGGNGWVGGAILVVLGFILLGQNLNWFTFTNWWALFLLLPAIGSFGNAWRITQADGGHFGAHARSSAIVGLIFCLAAGMFIFNLN